MVEIFFQNPPYGALIAVFAVLILWIPRDWRAAPVKRAPRAATKVGGRTLVHRRRSTEERLPEEDAFSLGKALARRATWLDFFRGIIGMHALAHYGFAWNWGVHSWIGKLNKPIFCLLIALVALLVQMARRHEGQVRLYVSHALVFGLCLGYLPLEGFNPWVTLSVGFGSLILMLGARPVVTGPSVALLIFVIAWWIAGYFFIGPLGLNFALIVGSGIALFPIALTLFLRRPVHPDTAETPPFGQLRSRSARG